MFDTKQTIGRWPSILLSLGVDKKTLSKSNCPCPWCGGKDRFRFTDQDEAGVWICNQCGSGNGFHFVEKWENTDFKGACKIIEEMLPKAHRTPEVHRVTSSDKMNAIWTQSVATEEGDPVVTYLRGRGLLPYLESEIRYHRALPYYHNGKITDSYPAMVARVRDANNKPITLHVTYLSLVPSNISKAYVKASVPAPKKVLSKSGNSPIIRLYPLDDTGILCIAEGIETALAVRKRTGLPVWSVLSAGGMQNFRLPQGVTNLEIWADNDLSFTGQLAAYRLAQRLRRDSKLWVSVLIPEETGKDWADL
jgi:putative DNA primase/helicase